MYTVERTKGRDGKRTYEVYFGKRFQFKVTQVKCPEKNLFAWLGLIVLTFEDEGSVRVFRCKHV